MFGKHLKCSFCGKTAEQVGKLVAGPKVYICDRCVAIADRIMREADAEQVVTTLPPQPGSPR